MLLIDQRGTGGSAPMQCDLRDMHNAQQVLGEEILPERLKACSEQLARTTDLTQHTTTIFADDLEEVRAALGYPQVDVFGQSYGTRAALEYLRRHGDHVRTLTLEGIVGPSEGEPTGPARLRRHHGCPVRHYRRHAIPPVRRISRLGSFLLAPREWTSPPELLISASLRWAIYFH